MQSRKVATFAEIKTISLVYKDINSILYSRMGRNVAGGRERWMTTMIDTTLNKPFQIFASFT